MRATPRIVISRRERMLVGRRRDILERRKDLTLPRLGATGKFPKGKLNEHDEGELTFGVANDGKLVHVNFGKPVAWFAVEPDLALRIAERLTAHAMAIKRAGLTEPAN